MTVNDIFAMGLALIQGTVTDNSDLQQLAVSWTNGMLAEAYYVENSIRRFKGLTELTAIPNVSALTDVVPYDSELLLNAFPKKVASLALYDEDNSTSLNYKAEYISALNDAAKLTETLVKDVYSAEADDE